MAEQKTRLLVVDDSALYRQAVCNVLRDAPQVSIVGVANGGLDALEKIETLDPDLLTLDVQMPDLDGIGVLREINRRRLRPKAIMLSSLTAEGAQVTTDALLEGAFDFILKPSGGDLTENRRRLREALDEKIDAFRQAGERPADAERRAGEAVVAAPEPEAATEAAACRAVLIGTSTGGPAALKEVLPGLASSFPTPILVVQHMPPDYTRALARRLDEMCKLDVAEAANGTEIRPGAALIAPGGRQMKLDCRKDRVLVRITDDPQENGCRPSMDYLLRSAVEVFDGDALAVIMTGMGRDGLHGCAELKRRGGRVFAQQRHGCLVYGMPKAVVEQGLADRVLPLGRLGTAITHHVKQGCTP
ncbi:MAG: chemotaxis-specific protein-glutamate methyltransferase CheB [Planctomycetota bacterium]|jgi:two-component system chemotaxis response regulator CheB